MTWLGLTSDMLVTGFGRRAFWFSTSSSRGQAVATGEGAHHRHQQDCWMVLPVHRAPAYRGSITAPAPGATAD
jgi:hypothetical protein